MTETPMLEALLLSADEVAQLLNCSRRHLDRLVARGDFPRSIKLNSKLIRWTREQVSQWIAAQVAATDDAEDPQ